MFSWTAFHDAAGYFRRIDWHATRKFVASCAEARALACGATFSPAALGGRMPHRPSTMCIWDGCAELGTFEHIASDCPRRLRNVPKPSELLSFGMNALLLTKRVTLMLCKLGFVWKRFFGPLSILDLCLLVCCWSWRLSGSLVLPTCTPFGVALPPWTSPLGWFVLFGFCSWFPFLQCWWFFTDLWFGSGASASRRHGVDCSRWASTFGVHGVLLLWAAAAAAVAAPSFCAVYLGAVQTKVHTLSSRMEGVFCHSAIRSAEQLGNKFQCAANAPATFGQRMWFQEWRTPNRKKIKMELQFLAN